MAKSNSPNSKRVPRPFGMTQMMIEYHNSNNPAILEKVKSFLINYWITNNMVFCGQPYSIQKFALALNIRVEDIRIVMRDQVLNSRVWDPEHQKEMMQGIIGEQLSWLMEDRMEVSQQVEVLRDSQGTTYKPFISAELTKALKLKQDASNNLLQLIRTLSGGGNTTNLFQVNIDNSQDNHTENNITIEEARTLIQQVNAEQALEKPKEVALLETQYDLAALPEVVAVKQNVDISKEGLNFSKAELNAVTDDYKGAMEIASEERHQIRREIEERIDPDAEDPELEIYEVEEEGEDFVAASFLVPQ